MIACSAPPTGSGFLAATLAHLDCQAQNIGEAGYQALANPASPIAVAVGSLFAIFIAIIALRFMTGRPLGVDEWVGGALKVGFVLAFAASWPAYRTVVYDVVLKGPAEISGSIGRASGLPGSEGGLASRLEGLDNSITALVVAGSGRFDTSSRPPEGAVALPLADDTALGFGKTLYVSSIIGSFGLLRLAGGLLLALAPLFAGLLLFEGARFLFFGWLRSLIAIAIGSIGIAIVLGVQLAIMEPWLSQVLVLRAARIATLSAPFELLALTLAFMIAMFGMFGLSLRIAFASTIVTKVQAMIERATQTLRSETTNWQPAIAGGSDNLIERTRAQEIAQSLNQIINRNAQNMGPTGSAGSTGSTGGGISANRTTIAPTGRLQNDTSAYIPLGRSYPTPSRRVNNQALKRRPTS
jgi:type IV secretion system protein VirB6